MIVFFKSGFFDYIIWSSWCDLMKSHDHWSQSQSTYSNISLCYFDILTIYHCIESLSLWLFQIVNEWINEWMKWLKWLVNISKCYFYTIELSYHKNFIWKISYEFQLITISFNMILKFINESFKYCITIHRNKVSRTLFCETD